MGKTFRMEKLVKQTAARLKIARSTLANSFILNCSNTSEDIIDDFAHATIEALRTYAAELRTYAAGLRQHLDVVRQMNNNDIKINAWNNRLQTLLAEFQDTSRLLSELQRRTDSIVSNLSCVSVPKDAPDDCVLLFAKIDFDLIENTADYADYHADNFMTLYPYFGCTKATVVPCGYTEADRKRDERTAENARKAAAKTKRDFESKSSGGRKGAKTRNEEANHDKTKETIRHEVSAMKADWDKRYPDRHKRGNKDHSDNKIYRTIASKHTKANGDPLYTWETIKSWYTHPKRSKPSGNK